MHATGTLNEQGVDLAVEAEIDYGGEGEKKQTAKVATSALKLLKNQAVITGTKGTITVSWTYFDIYILKSLNEYWTVIDD